MPLSNVALLVLQSTPFCNINCQYCYLTERSSKASMSYHVIESAIDRLVEAGLIGDRIIICWHAGEPLTLPVSYYRHAIHLIRARLPESCKMQIKFQSNGTLLTHEWCNLFLENDVHVGISIDGPEEMHDRTRITRSGKGTFSKTIEGIRLLKKCGVDFNVICVLTRSSLSHAKDLFEFFDREEIKKVCFNIEETEGGHKSKLMEQGDSHLLFRDFLKDYIRLIAASGNGQWVREIDKTFRSLFLSGRGHCNNQQVNPFEIVTVDVNGNLSTFSPELIGTSAPEFGNFVFGNVVKNSITDMCSSIEFRKTYSAIKEGVAICRSNCEYFDICGGGAPSNKFFESGSFLTSETAYCRAIIKSAADVLLDHMEKCNSSLSPTFKVFRI